MDYAVVIKDGDGWQALVKSNHYERCYAVAKLCDLHLAKVMKVPRYKLSTDRQPNLRVGMHPDREAILARLLALEFPLPAPKEVLEGEYAAMESVKRSRPRHV